MLVTNHVLSGAILGGVMPGPVSSFAVGVASHFLLDSVPHWGEVTWEELVHVGRRDGIVGLGAMAALTLAAQPNRRAAVLAGMAGAAFPDLDKPSQLFFGRSPFPQRFDAFHVGIQRESSDRMRQELVVGAVAALLAVVAVRRR